MWLLVGVVRMLEMKVVNNALAVVIASTALTTEATAKRIEVAKMFHLEKKRIDSLDKLFMIY
jgi:hypothetical protein